MAAITQTCTNCSNQFLIIDNEQKILEEKKLPLPTQCPSCRQKRRLKLRGSERKLYKASCAVCGKEVVISYNPQNVQNKILCKKDYEDYFATNDPIINDPLPDIQ